MIINEIVLMNDTVVYRHVKPCGEVFYVGIGNKRRPYIKWHRNPLWHHVVNKYPDYKVEVVATGLRWELACELEVLMILEYGRRDLGTGTLVNMTAGGDGSGGRVYTEETRQKLSAIHKGKKLSAETKQKMSAARQKLTFKQAEEIRHRYQTEKITYVKLAQEYGASYTTIWSIVNNQTYTPN